MSLSNQPPQFHFKASLRELQFFVVGIASGLSGYALIKAAGGEPAAIIFIGMIVSALVWIALGVTRLSD
jgi:hypothetical protein